MHNRGLQAPQRSCILLAESDAELRESLRQSLLTQHDVVAVEDGQAALEALDRVLPDLVLTAVSMPRLDGSGLIRALRRIQGARTIPVITVSAYPGEEFRTDGDRAGADDHLVKPFSPRELLARVDALLKLAQARREAADRERFQLRKLQSVYGLTRLVAQGASIDDVYTEAMDGIQRALGVDRCAILLFDDDRVMRFKAWRMLSNEYRQALEGHSPWRADDTSPPIVAIESALSDPSVATYRAQLRAEGVGALAFVPLMHEGVLLGKLMLSFNQLHRFTSEELELAQSVADHTALAIGRLRNHDALQQSEESFRCLIETAAEGVWQIDAQARTRYMNRPMGALLGGDAGSFIGRDAFDLLHPDERDEARAQWSRRVRGESARTEWRLRRSDGAYVRVSMLASPITDGHGRVMGAVAMVTDVTQQRQAERRLLTEHAIARLLSDAHTIEEAAPKVLAAMAEPFEATLAQLWLVDTAQQSLVHVDGWMAEPSAELEQLVRAARETSFTRGKGAPGRVWASGAPEVARSRRALAVPIAAGGEVFGVVELRSASEIEVNAPIVQTTMAIGHDVAQFIRRRRAERELMRHREHLENLVAERTAELEHSHQQLRLSERMAALGTLSAGLGHDMGNLLLPIRARIEALLSEPLPDRVRENVQAIRQCTDYLQSLTNGLRLLALDPAESGSAVQETDLEEWWPNVEASLNNALPRGIRLPQPRLSALPRVAIAPHKLTQAVFNLVKNAGDALRGRGWGNVGFTAELVNQDERGSRSPAETPLPWMRLVVSDDGPGMSREVMSRATEPFFTTKTRSLSTGLGLSLVHGIVMSAGGSVRIDSSPGRGAAIAITLPLATAAARRPQTDPAEAVVSLHDPRGRTMVKQVLSSMGFAVCESDQPEPHSSARLWIIESMPEQLAAARRFLEGDSTRAVLVAGPYDKSTAPAGLFSLGEPLRFSHVRDTIRLVTPRVLETSHDKRTDSRLVCR